MPTIQTQPIQGYSIAGYQAGDRVGAGVVVDPATLSNKEALDTKIVTVDLNLNGQADAQDDKLVVKLPPKGFIPAGWKGSSTLSGGQKMSAAGGDMAAGGFIGAIVGGFSGAGLGAMADAGYLGSKLGSNPVAVGVAVGVIGLAAGIAIAYKSNETIRGIKQDGEAARNSTVPDLVQPKYILNQYLLQQSGASAVVGQLSTIGK